MAKFSLQNYLFEKFQSSILQDKILNNPSHLLNYVQFGATVDKKNFRLGLENAYSNLLGFLEKIEGNTIESEKSIKKINSSIEDINKRISNLFKKPSLAALLKLEVFPKYNQSSIIDADFTMVLKKDLDNFFNSKLGGSFDNFISKFSAFYFNANNVSKYGDRANWLVAITGDNGIFRLRKIKNILKTYHLDQDLSSFKMKEFESPCQKIDVLAELRKPENILHAEADLSCSDRFGLHFSLDYFFSYLGWGKDPDDYVIFYGINDYLNRKKNGFDIDNSKISNTKYFDIRKQISQEEALKIYNWVDKKTGEILPYDINLDKFNKKFRESNIKRFNNKKSLLILKRELKDFPSYKEELKNSIRELNDEMKNLVMSDNYVSDTSKNQTVSNIYEEIHKGFEALANINRTLKNFDERSRLFDFSTDEGIRTSNYYIQLFLNSCSKIKNLISHFKEAKKKLLPESLNEAFKSKTLRSIADLYKNQRVSNLDYWKIKNEIDSNIEDKIRYGRNPNNSLNVNKELKKIVDGEYHKKSLGKTFNDYLQTQIDKIPEEDVKEIPVDKVFTKKFSNNLLFWITKNPDGSDALLMVSQGKYIYYFAQLKSEFSVKIPKEKIDVDRLRNDFDYNNEIFKSIFNKKESYFESISKLTVRGIFRKFKDSITKVYGISNEDLVGFSIPKDIVEKRLKLKKWIAFEKNQAWENIQRYKTIILKRRAEGNSNKAIQLLKEYQKNLFDLFNDVSNMIEEYLDSDVIDIESDFDLNRYLPENNSLTVINSCLSNGNKILSLLKNIENLSLTDEISLETIKSYEKENKRKLEWSFSDLFNKNPTIESKVHTIQKNIDDILEVIEKITK